MTIFEQNKPTMEEWTSRVVEQGSAKDLEFFNSQSNKWMGGCDWHNPTWDCLRYRFPPKTITVNDVECEANFIPDEGEDYYYHNGQYVYGAENEATVGGDKTISSTPVFRSQEAALAYHSAVHKPFMLGGES